MKTTTRFATCLRLALTTFCIGLASVDLGRAESLAPVPYLYYNGNAASLMAADGKTFLVGGGSYDFDSRSYTTPRNSRGELILGGGGLWTHVSKDGRFAIFQTSFDPETGEFVPLRLYRWNRDAGGLAAVSQAGDGTYLIISNQISAVSEDGSTAAFLSNNQPIFGPDLWIWREGEGATPKTPVTIAGMTTAVLTALAMTPDGKSVFFSCSLKDDQTSNFIGALVRYDRLSDAFTVLLSGEEFNVYSLSTSDDGTQVAFENFSALIPEDTNGVTDVYVLNTSSGFLQRASVGPAGVQANGESRSPQISGDGRFVVFQSDATNLVTIDFNGATDVFRRDLSAGLTIKISKLNDGSSIVGPSGLHSSQVISTDGSRATFGLNNFFENNVVWDANGVVPTAPPLPLPQPGLSGGDLAHLQEFVNGRNNTVKVLTDNRFVHSTGFNVPFFDGRNAIQDAATGAFEYIDVASGTPTTLPVTDGNRFVNFATAVGIIPTDTNGKVDIYRRDRQLNLTTKLSQAFDGSQTLGDVGEIAASDDALWVAFVSSDLSILPGLNGQPQIFLMDAINRDVTLVSKSLDGTASIGFNSEPRISADGRYVVFISDDSSLTEDDDNPTGDVFRYDRTTGALERVSVNLNGANFDASSVFNPGISGDGTVVAFCTEATNVVPGGDPNAFSNSERVTTQNAHLQRSGGFDVFLYDFKTAEIEVVDVDNLGERPQQRTPDGVFYIQCNNPSFNFDGTRVVFDSNARDLVAYSAGSLSNIGVFLRDRVQAKTFAISYNTGFYNSGLFPKLGTAGDKIYFIEGTSQASDAVFVRDISAPVITSPLTASATVGLPFTYQVTASNSPQSYTATNLPAGLTFDAGSALISGTPTQVGSKNVTLTASTAGGTGSATLTITVALATVPVITSPLSANATVGQPFSYQITASGNPSSFDATGLPAGITINKSTGLISGTPSTAGASSVNLSATNTSGTGTAILMLTVTATSSAPVITSPGSADGTVGQPFSYQITATNSPTSFGASGLPSGLAVNSDTGLVSGKPSASGSFAVNLSATNSSGTGTAVLTVSISATASAPVITSPATASGGVGQSFAYQITATNSPTSFGASGLPAGLTVNTSTGIISGIPSTAGDFAIGLSATNGAGTGNADLALHIEAADAPPVITSPLTATATIGEPFIYQILATNQPTSFTASNLPDGLTFDETLGVISGQPAAEGSDQVVLGATNAGGTGTATLTLTVQGSTSGITIISGPITGRTGETFSYQIRATGITSSAVFSATGLPAGLITDPATGVISGATSVAGVFAVQLGVSDSGQSGSVTVAFTFSSDPALPVIDSADAVTLVVGAAFSYKITAPNSSDPALDPTTFSIIGELPAGLTFNATTGIISGSYTPPVNKAIKAPEGGASIPSRAVVGRVQLFATNSHGTTTRTLVFLTAVPQLLNISTRMQVLAGDNVLIGGFIITGNAPKKVILRAIGPALIPFGLADALADPVLELHMPDMTVVTNDNWKETQQTEIEATGLQPSDDLESAIVATLAPGAYTAIVKGKDGGTGVGLVEAYDLDEAADSTMANISTRGFVDTGDNVMIGGVIIGGRDSQVLVRAIGPALAPFGITDALEDPVLELHDKDGALITENDNWKDAQESDIEATKLAPTDDRESAILATLAPDSYTAIVRGKNDTTGVALVEVYNVSP